MSNVWITKDGKEFLVKAMKTSHIQNCVRMLNKYILEVYGALGGITGEMMEDDMHRQIDGMEEQVKVFQEEIESRMKVGTLVSLGIYCPKKKKLLFYKARITKLGKKRHTLQLTSKGKETCRTAPHNLDILEEG